MSPRYSEEIMEHFLDPQNRGTLSSPSSVGVSGVPGRGPYFLIQIQCRDNAISNASFQCHNCGVTVACGSVLTEVIKGQTLDSCAQIDPDQLSSQLGGIPPDKMHVPEFVIRALRQAIEELPL